MNEAAPKRDWFYWFMFIIVVKSFGLFVTEGRLIPRFVVVIEIPVNIIPVLMVIEIESFRGISDPRFVGVVEVVIIP